MTYKPDGERVLKTIRYLFEMRETGATWYELGSEFGWHHGQASGVLSTLHREGRIARLKEKRGKSSVYVDLMFVNGRETATYGVVHKRVDESKNETLNNAISALMMVRASTRKSLSPHNKTCWRDHSHCALDVAIKQLQLMKDDNGLFGL
jgi:hypothetical protein